MTPKEIVQKGYDCFASGDMETFVGLGCTVTINGMHKFSGTYNGINEFMGVLALIPSHYDNFSVTVANMISEGDQDRQLNWMNLPMAWKLNLGIFTKLKVAK